MKLSITLMSLLLAGCASVTPLHQYLSDLDSRVEQRPVVQSFRGVDYSSKIKPEQCAYIIYKRYIDESGAVTSAEILHTSYRKKNRRQEFLERKLLRSVKESTYSPALSEGKPVAVWGVGTTRYKPGHQCENQAEMDAFKTKYKKYIRRYAVRVGSL